MRDFALSLRTLLGLLELGEEGLRGLENAFASDGEEEEHVDHNLVGSEGDGACSGGSWRAHVPGVAAAEGDEEEGPRELRERERLFLGRPGEEARDRMQQPPALGLLILRRAEDVAAIVGSPLLLHLHQPRVDAGHEVEGAGELRDGCRDRSARDSGLEGSDEEDVEEDVEHRLDCDGAEGGDGVLGADARCLGDHAEEGRGSAEAAHAHVAERELEGLGRVRARADEELQHGGASENEGKGHDDADHGRDREGHADHAPRRCRPLIAGDGAGEEGGGCDREEVD
mmetsp:Transcript_748/g.1754  ORF Transcript_748/g.1754 Transcript_748/m.1754 type:complete len:285 (-) Transcript_748:714-1568(-)